MPKPESLMRRQANRPGWDSGCAGVSSPVNSAKLVATVKVPPPGIASRALRQRFMTSGQASRRPPPPTGRRRSTPDERPRARRGAVQHLHHLARRGVEINGGELHDLLAGKNEQLLGKPGRPICQRFQILSCEPTGVGGRIIPPRLRSWP